MSSPISEPGGLEPIERRAVIGLGSILSIRILGLFLLLPVLALYTESLPGATPAKIGLALGIYGLTQALLQIPSGHLSDRWGRKPVIALGLIVFALGGVLAAVADTANGIIFGRALQGAGAISAAVTALLADLIRDQFRTRAMAFVGGGIGLMFIVSIVGGPVMANVIGVRGIFWSTVVLAATALLLLVWLVPAQPRGGADSSKPASGGLLAAVTKPELRHLFVGIFALHWMITAIFLAVPFMLRDQVQLAQSSHWQVYLGAVLLSLMVTVPLILRVERAGSIRIFMGAIALLIVSQGLLAFGPPTFTAVLLGLAVFFAGFNFLEARLPALVSKTAPEGVRGAALGVYATAQFLGAFFGGWTAGWLMGGLGMRWVFAVAALLACVWVASVVTRELKVAPDAG